MLDQAWRDVERVLPELDRIAEEGALGMDQTVVKAMACLVRAEVGLRIMDRSGLEPEQKELNDDK
jgi:hypothetical protein